MLPTLKKLLVLTIQFIARFLLDLLSNAILTGKAEDMSKRKPESASSGERKRLTETSTQTTPTLKHYQSFDPSDVAMSVISETRRSSAPPSINEVTHEDSASSASEEDMTASANTETNLLGTGAENESPGGPPNNFFRDGKTRVDFVLVYEQKSKSEFINFNIGDPSEEEAAKHEMWRQNFLTSLQKMGVQLEEEAKETEKLIIYFIKMSVPWPVLCQYAEELSMRAPLQLRSTRLRDQSQVILKKLKIPNIMVQEVPNPPPRYFTCAFKESKLERFLGSSDHETFFTNTQRSRIAYEILCTASYGNQKKGELGVERLKNEGVFTAYYPLHEGPYKCEEGIILNKNPNPRQVLHYYWAQYKIWYKYQPLDHIREYFGEKIGIYFAWLGLYNAWLIPAAITGLLIFLYGLITIEDNTPAREICDKKNNFTMCPLCPTCARWNISDSCKEAKISYLFDHPGTVFYAIFISFWAVTFLEYWKRKNASLAYHWDCLDFEEEEERPRPEFSAKAPLLEENPVTGILEPSFPSGTRMRRIVSGIGLLSLMICLVLIFILGVIIYRVVVSISLFQNVQIRPKAKLISSISAALINFLIIITLGKIYEKMAYRLTEWEMHRTQTSFEDNLTFKVFVFQFVNFYSSIFYIAFFKGKFVGYPGNYNKIFGVIRNEDCSAGGCLIELAVQLAVIMIGKQVLNNAKEIVVPKAKSWWRKKAISSDSQEDKMWHSDYQLVENEGLFQEYLEMVLQFGFITVFVAAFPLAPLFALLNNWIEVRLDAKKLICETRRPVADRAQDIGIWFAILEFMARLAVISNAFLIAFTSEFLPRLLYQYESNWSLEGYVNSSLAKAPLEANQGECRYRDFRDENGNHTSFYWRLMALRLLFIIIFEHVVFGICHLIDCVIPDIPKELELAIKRERYLAKQTLADLRPKEEETIEEEEV